MTKLIILLFGILIGFAANTKEPIYEFYTIKDVYYVNGKELSSENLGLIAEYNTKEEALQAGADSVATANSIPNIADYLEYLASEGNLELFYDQWQGIYFIEYTGPDYFNEPDKEINLTIFSTDWCYGE